ncbi:MAG: thioredoxin family protein [Candidatus Eisenbacteria bacterium]|uniref:Thioredoxin family protein n=1 Tax=Eiseniibacteriota bacterium TaxID=2212470 RepID=A0A9D6LB11_UNCEI|nr:thioredoxin family protein [Candidatus Eisenbacteria bacterium]MBI3540265.1 thioredoxin family protein [Candidatus Eisenbacteria bacterium]
MPPVDGAPGSTRWLPTGLVIAAAVLLVARVGTGIYEERHPPALADLVHWRPIETAVAEARQAHRPILYDFTADWCPPCRAMKREVFADPQAAAQIERLFVPVRVLDRQREEGRNPAAVESLQTRYSIDSFPTLVVAPVGQGEAKTFAGYGGKAATLQQLSRAAVALRIGGAFPMPFPGAGHP